MKTMTFNIFKTQTIKNPILEMIESRTYRKKIAASRKEKKLYSANQVKKLLNL